MNEETTGKLYTAVVEIPKGCDRRIHMSYDKSGFIDLGPIKEHISTNDGVMPVHYGYIEGVMNKIEGDEVDIIVFSNLEYKTGDKVQVNITGMLTREDGDNKVIAQDSSVTDSAFESLLESERKLILDYFGFKSPIVSVSTGVEAIRYIENNKNTEV